MEAVVRKAGRIALPIALAVLGDREDAAEVAQDVALDVLKGSGRLRSPESFDAWVRQIAARRSIHAARRRRLLRGVEFPLDEVAGAGGRATPATEIVLLQASLR